MLYTIKYYIVAVCRKSRGQQGAVWAPDAGSGNDCDDDCDDDHHDDVGYEDDDCDDDLGYDDDDDVTQLNASHETIKHNSPGEPMSLVGQQQYFLTPFCM